MCMFPTSDKDKNFIPKNRNFELLTNVVMIDDFKLLQDKHCILSATKGQRKNKFNLKKVEEMLEYTNQMYPSDNSLKEINFSVPKYLFFERR